MTRRKNLAVEKDANLRQLSEQELAVARDAIVCAEWLRRPHWPLRLGAGLAVVTLLSLLDIKPKTVWSDASAPFG